MAACCCMPSICRPISQAASHVEVSVAAGTIFLDVLIWRARLDVAAVRGAGGSTLRSRHAPLLRLKGHEGSIHRHALALSSPSNQRHEEARLCSTQLNAFQAC